MKSRVPPTLVYALWRLGHPPPALCYAWGKAANAGGRQAATAFARRHGYLKLPPMMSSSSFVMAC